VNLLNEIRPRVEYLTDERSLGMLNAVLSSGQRRRKARWNRVAAFGLCGVIVTGGTAYASGLVPDIVTDRFQQIRGGQDGWPDPIYGERLIADVSLSNGRHARVWYANTTDGQCVIRDMTGTVTRPEDFGVGCARWGHGSEQTDPRRGVLWPTPKDGPAVVYGDFRGVTADVARVQVAGPDWTRSFAVTNGAFSGEVPSDVEGDRVRFTYLNAVGEEVASKVTTVTIESE
jgi:hypothetical protein